MEERKNLVERILLSRQEMIDAERVILRNEHLRRYAAIRRFCYGRTLDFACGCGYGSFLLAANPDVTTVTAVDQDQEVLAFAQREYAHHKVEYRSIDVSKIEDRFDTLVCLETIEHLRELSVVPELVERCRIDNVIVSFPDKRTTNYNPFHFHDLVFQEVVDLFPRHVAYHSIRFVDSQSILFIRLPKNAPSHIFRNLSDL